MITGKRIRSSHNHLSPYLSKGQVFQLGKKLSSLNDSILGAVGFSRQPSIGESILPSDSLGRCSYKNAHGYFGPPKYNLPKIPFEVSFSSEIKDWHDNHHSVLINQVRRKYQRDFFPPLSIELSLANDISGETHIVTEKMIRGEDENRETLAINLLLEIFGACEIYDENGARIINAPVKRVNWRMLPPGLLSWEKFRMYVSETLANVQNQHKEIVEARIKFINSFAPHEVYIGLGGFSDYMAFRFKSENTWLLECVRSGNATYVMDSHWRKISQLTKSEVIQGSLAKGRIIHNKSWTIAIERVLAEVV